MRLLDDPPETADGYGVVHEDDVPAVDLSEVEAVTPDLTVRPIDEALGLEKLAAKVWHVPPGEEITYHAHPEEEELYYVLAGTFSVKLGRSGEAETREVGPGTFFSAAPEVGHGYRNVGDEEGIVLAFGAPTGDDRVLDPHDL